MTGTPICRECGARTTIHCDVWNCPYLRSKETSDTYDAPADSIGSYEDAIRALRCEHLAEQLKIAVNALKVIRGYEAHGLPFAIYAIARDTLLEINRNSSPVNRGEQPPDPPKPY